MPFIQRNILTSHAEGPLKRLKEKVERLVITEVMGFDEADADAVRESRPYVNDLMWVHEGR